MKTLDECADAIATVRSPNDAKHRQTLIRVWQAELCRAAASGELRMHSADSWRPIRVGEPGALVHALTLGVVSLKELNRWLDDRGIDLVFTELNFRALSGRPVKHSAYSATVQEHASECADAWANDYFTMTGDIPSRETVAKGIAKALLSRFGKDWDAKTIERHSLKRWFFRPISRTAQKAHLKR